MECLAGSDGGERIVGSLDTIPAPIPIPKTYRATSQGGVGVGRLPPVRDSLLVVELAMVWLIL